MSTAVAITGTGAVTAALGLDALPDAVRARAGRVERVTQLVLAAAGRALDAAGLAATDGPPRPRLGVVLGTAFGCFLTNETYQRRLAVAGPAGASPRLFAATVSNAAAGELGIAYRLGGPAVTLSAGAASGGAALAHAVDLLRAGRAEALVAGGMDAVDVALARWLDDGGLAVGRPAAEAAAMVVLERPAQAARRGASVIGEVMGIATGFEPAPEARDAGRGLGAAVAAALADAGVRARDVELVVCAAPPALQGLEERALAAVLGEHRPARVAPKDVLGETFGAAGPLALLVALAEAPAGRHALVLDVCASGHVAALVVRRGADS